MFDLNFLLLQFVTCLLYSTSSCSLTRADTFQTAAQFDKVNKQAEHVLVHV